VNWQFLQGNGTFSNGTVRSDAKEKGSETEKFDSRNLARLVGFTNYGIGANGLTGSSWDFKNNSNTISYNYIFSPKQSLDSEGIVRHTEILSSSHEEVYKNPGPYAGAS
jgi:hypothetical protein